MLYLKPVDPPTSSRRDGPVLPAGRCIDFDALARVREEQDQSPGSSTSRIPVISLKVPSISSTMAAKLATSLIGHVLFLKNQVPFPVNQLSRMPGGAANPRAKKLKAELLSSFDTLSSHLLTTFTALSTAYALKGCESAFPKPNEKLACPQMYHAHLGILVGPSIGSAKAKVIFAVDGLEAKQWGLREDRTGLDDEEDEEETEQSESEEESDEEETESVESDCESESESGSDIGSDPIGDEIRNDDSPPSPPPASRSPSPEGNIPTPLSAKVIPASSKQPHIAPPPAVSFAEEQQALRAAERSLSMALANASACEDDGCMDMSSELAPTQTHILLRAPRRFNHPSWIPRQNVTTMLDGATNEFMAESNLPFLPGTQPPAMRRPTKAKKDKAIKPEGVWIKCQNHASPMDNSNPSDAEEVNELDEMIWWSWDETSKLPPIFMSGRGQKKKRRINDENTPGPRPLGASLPTKRRKVPKSAQSTLKPSATQNTVSTPRDAPPKNEKAPSANSIQTNIQLITQQKYAGPPDDFVKATVDEMLKVVPNPTEAFRDDLTLSVKEALPKALSTFQAKARISFPSFWSEADEWLHVFKNPPKQATKPHWYEFFCFLDSTEIGHEHYELGYKLAPNTLANAYEDWCLMTKGQVDSDQTTE
ncbi:hypothetical protein ONZ45_g5424 [Pleurotus djamor]|nr:hypothetical protein ONZ45_g5424 [Pleurotus djamor]